MSFEEFGMSVDVRKAFKKVHPIAEAAIGEGNGVDLGPTVLGCEEEGL